MKSTGRFFILSAAVISTATLVDANFFDLMDNIAATTDRVSRSAADKTAKASDSFARRTEDTTRNWQDRTEDWSNRTREKSTNLFGTLTQSANRITGSVGLGLEDKGILATDHVALRKHVEPFPTKAYFEALARGEKPSNLPPKPEADIATLSRAIEDTLVYISSYKGPDEKDTLEVK